MKSLKKTQVGIKMEEKKSTQSLEASLVNRPEDVFSWGYHDKAESDALMRVTL